MNRSYLIFLKLYNFIFHFDCNVSFHVLYTGRLYQVEYAMEAIGHAGTCLGILASDGVLLAAERRNTNKLLDEGTQSEKIYKLHQSV